MKTEWHESENLSYYYDDDTGRILGSAFRYPNQTTVWVAKIEKSDMPYTNENEMILGHFISLQSAKTMVEEYWNIQNRTLLE